MWITLLEVNLTLFLPTCRCYSTTGAATSRRHQCCRQTIKSSQVTPMKQVPFSLGGHNHTAVHGHTCLAKSGRGASSRYSIVSVGVRLATLWPALQGSEIRPSWKYPGQRGSLSEMQACPYDDNSCDARKQASRHLKTSVKQPKDQRRPRT